MNLQEMSAGAERGITAMQIALGHAYLKGRDLEGTPIKQDHAAAIYWFEQAAAKGAGTAMFILGTMYQNGLGVNVNLDKAIELFEASAKQGLYLPCLHLARIYANEGSYQSWQKASFWYGRVLSFDGQIDGADELAEARAYLMQR